MAKRRQAKPKVAEVFPRLLQMCPACGNTLWTRYYNNRTIRFRNHIRLFRFPVYRCQQAGCPLIGKPYRYELESRMAPRYTKYSLNVISLTGMFKPDAGGIAPLKKLLGKRHIRIPLTSIPPLLDRFEKLLSGPFQDDATIKDAFKAQGCVILDVFPITEIGGLCVSYWVIQELISSTLLAMRPAAQCPTPRDLLHFITNVGRTMPVPVIGFTTDISYTSITVLQLLLMYSGKGPTRLCEIPSWDAGNQKVIRRRLTRMVQNYIDFRNKRDNNINIGQPNTPRGLSRISKSSVMLPASTGISTTETFDEVEVEPNNPMSDILRDWARTGGKQHQGDLNYDYNWDFYK